MMKVIGITGGIACGKSAAARIFAEEGRGTLVSADQLGHEVLASADFKRLAFLEWGTAIFQPEVNSSVVTPGEKPPSNGLNGSVETAFNDETGEKPRSNGIGEDFWKNRKIDRKGLAALVFDPEDTLCRNLKRLNAMTHPAIAARVSDRIERSRAAGEKIAVLDAPLLYEAGMESLCDVVVFVHADPEVRRERAERRGWPEGELERREAVQTAIQVKRDRADFIVENNGGFHALRGQVREILSAMGVR